MEENEKVEISENLLSSCLVFLNLYPVYLTYVIYDMVPRQKVLIDDLLNGAPLPAATEFVIGNYRLSWVLPAISITFVIFAYFYKRQKAITHTLAIVITLGVTSILQAMIHFCVNSPLIEIYRNF